MRADLLRAEKSDAGESINVAHIPKLLHHLLVTGLPDIFPNLIAEVFSFVQGGTGDDLRWNRHEFALCLLACAAHSCIQAAVLFFHVGGLCLEGASMQEHLYSRVVNVERLISAELHLFRSLVVTHESDGHHSVE